VSKFTIKADPALDRIEEGIGLRVAHNNVLVPEALVRAVDPYALGNDAVAFAGFLASFPTAVSGSLGIPPGAVVDFAESLTNVLEKSGADVSAIRARPVRRSYGALHPGLI
jgi:hypothetical protein